LAGEWLGRLGLTEQALVCGPALPRAIEDQAAAFASGGPRRIYNNCSGKHCGFLSMARHMGAGLGYAAWDHPAQRLYRDILAEFAGLDPAALVHGGDGCGLPAIALPIGAMARAMARFGAGEARSATRRDAARRVREAMIAHPHHLAATDSATARLIRACGGKLAAKGGAEGYLVACVTEPALGIAIKVADGDPAGRAKMGVLADLLGKLGVLPAAAAKHLVAEVEPPIADSNGITVGRVEVVILRVHTEGGHARA
jgi:L-asparaginase II